jgi:hypothetical protein
MIYSFFVKALFVCVYGFDRPTSYRFPKLRPLPDERPPPDEWPEPDERPELEERPLPDVELLRPP